MYQYQVSFQDAVKRGLDNYCNFQGRASRSEFWWFYLATALVGFVLSILFNVAAALNSSALTAIFGAIYGIVYLALLLPSLGLGVRRLHDTGRSGWNLLWCFLPLIGMIILIIYWVQDSQMQPNQYGPVPNLAE